ANAGHPYAFLVPPDGGQPRRLRATNPPFGIVDLDDYGEETITWAPAKDLLFLFTDGLSDAISPTHGEQTLVDVVAERRDLPIDDLLEAIFAVEPSAEKVPSDDRTAVLVRI